MQQQSEMTTGMNKVANRLRITYSIVFFMTLGCCLLQAKNSLQQQEEKDFVSSFVNNYGFTANARDTREYHAFVLGKARDYFSKLENYVQEQGFTLHGRMIIAGYQEDAIPSYYTSFNDSIIDDEISIKTKVGWDFASGNVFGYLTGFLLKDSNSIGKRFQGKSMVKHIMPERIGLFDDRAEIFQRHAFGDAFNAVMQIKRQVVKHMMNRDAQSLLICLRNFWKYLYVEGVRDGSGQLIATQDILFSIYYAQYLLNSTLPIITLFVGPDITYPIEILHCQKKEATAGAQVFVEHFIDHLHPIEDKKTAYIFCSFVDGVGKSTLLGNIKNWLMHGNNVDRYERVDNSSSQQATVHVLNDKVYIVDLPAQISHVIAKPDGYVYVDVRTIKELSNEHIEEIVHYVEHNKQTLLQHFTRRIRTIMAHKHLGSCDPADNDEPAVAYSKNICVLELEHVAWIPFSYHDQHFLFNVEDCKQLRMLTPFKTVHSYGLKVVEPEQMIFSKGVTVPLHFDLFLQDLANQMKNVGVEQIVFVDFMSMYPRSSRENIRVNFLLQQLKLIFGDTFDIETSLYRSFVNHQELYWMLKQCRDDLATACVLETTMRWALYILIQQCKEQHELTIPLHRIKELLQETCSMLFKEHKQQLVSIVKDKIIREYHDIRTMYAFDKEFEALVRFDFESLQAFSIFMQELFTKKVHNVYFNGLWSGLEGALCAKNLEEENQPSNIITQSNGTVTLLDNGCPVEIVYSFDSECRNKTMMKDFFSAVRAYWYAALSNVLSWHYINNCWETQKIIPVPPLIITADNNNHFYGVRKHLEYIDGADLKPPALFFSGGLSQAEQQWGTYMGIPHCVDWTNIATNQGVYAFDYKVSSENAHKNPVSLMVGELKRNQKEWHRTHYFVPTSLLFNSLDRLNMWQQYLTEKKQYPQNNEQGKKTYAQAAQLFVRACATLDMIIKDLDAEVMVRKGSRDDFIAALKLLERITLPKYFGITFDKPLFDDYTKVEPVIPWKYLE